MLDPLDEVFLDAAAFESREIVWEASSPPVFSASANRVALRSVVDLRVGCPAPLFTGPSSSHTVLGSGVLVADGKMPGILTAAHVVYDRLAGQRMRDVFAVFIPPPPSFECLVTAPQDVYIDLTPNVPATAVSVLGGHARQRTDPYDRADIAVAYIPPEDVATACSYDSLSPLSIGDPIRIGDRMPAFGIYIAVGAPKSCQNLAGQRKPTLVAHNVTPCRIYLPSRPVDLADRPNPVHVGFGAHRVSEGKGRLDWTGISGGPIWFVEPRREARDKVLDPAVQCSPDDFCSPRLIAMAWAQNPRTVFPAGSALAGFRREVVAHAIDSDFLFMVRAMLSHLPSSGSSITSGTPRMSSIYDNWSPRPRVGIGGGVPAPAAWVRTLPARQS